MFLFPKFFRLKSAIAKRLRAFDSLGPEVYILKFHNMLTMQPILSKLNDPYRNSYKWFKSMGWGLALNSIPPSQRRCGLVGGEIMAIPLLA